MKVLAPGKLILSGEHAVVHGSPALALAINRYTEVKISNNLNSTVQFQLKDLAEICEKSISELATLKNRTIKHYLEYLDGRLAISDVIQNPLEFVQVAVAMSMAALHDSQGMIVNIKSSIPLGAGMGSSASVIIAIIYALMEKTGIKLKSDALFTLALTIENFQHGVSSGLDLYLAERGGCLYKHGKTLTPRNIPKFPIHVVNTGKPVSTTGECVHETSIKLKDKGLLHEFTNVTNAMDHALNYHHLSQVYESVRANHQLLTQIGVVPQRIQQFIQDIENENGAAKICGAGSLAGDAAGMVWIMAEDEARISQICDNYHYERLVIKGEAKGVHTI